jgi:hypothetical protein
MKRYDITYESSNAYEEEKGKYVLYSEATDPVEVSREMLPSGFVLVTKEQWDFHHAELATVKAERDALAAINKRVIGRCVCGNYHCTICGNQMSVAEDATFIECKYDNATLRKQVATMREALEKCTTSEPLYIGSQSRLIEINRTVQQAIKEVSNERA